MANNSFFIRGINCEECVRLEEEVAELRGRLDAMEAGPSNASGSIGSLERLRTILQALPSTSTNMSADAMQQSIIKQIGELREALAASNLERDRLAQQLQQREDQRANSPTADAVPSADEAEPDQNDNPSGSDAVENSNESEPDQHTDESESSESEDTTSDESESEDEPDTPRRILNDLEDRARDFDRPISQTIEFLIQKCERSVVMRNDVKSFTVRKEDGYLRTRGFTINNGVVSGQKYGFDFKFRRMLEIGRIGDRPAVKANWGGSCDHCTATTMITTIHESNGAMHIANHSVDSKRTKHRQNCPEYTVRR